MACAERGGTVQTPTFDTTRFENRARGAVSCVHANKLRAWSEIDQRQLRAHVLGQIAAAFAVTLTERAAKIVSPALNTVADRPSAGVRGPHADTGREKIGTEIDGRKCPTHFLRE